MRPNLRTLLASFLIAAVAPIGLAALDLEQPAFAKNGNGNGGDHGGGHGGGNGGGHGGGNSDHGKSANAKGQAKSKDAETGDDSETEGLAPNELGKLNGVLHANPNAIAHASANSPIGTAREFGKALADFLGQSDENTTEGEDATAEDQTDPVTTDDLAEMMARMTNKTVTADQVQAVAEKVGIQTTDETADDGTTDDGTTDDQASDEPTEGDQTPALDQATAQEIADKANAIHESGGDTSDDTDGGETADAGDTTDETVTN
ncbi:MAG: hypothetical protein R3D05_09865 [Dongiaceae bacterium]